MTLAQSACRTVGIETPADTDLRLGILTSGGDAPGMNAVVAGACEQAERRGGLAYGVRGGFGGLAMREAEPITAADAREHAHESGTWLGTSRWKALATPDGLAECRRALGDLGLTALLVIGGNGSAMGARVLAADIPVAFVPATIDRDIDGSESTIGMDSAIRYAVAVVDQLRITARSLPGRAFLVQTLGAPHGFLADAVAAAAGVDHVLVPEREIDLDAVASALRDLAPSGSAHRGHVRGGRRRGADRRGARRALRHPRPPDDPRPRAARGAPVGARHRDRPRRGPRRRGRARERTLDLHRPRRRRGT